MEGRVASINLTPSGGELERDGITAAELVSDGPDGLADLVARCGGRIVLMENRDGLPSQA